MEKKKLPSETFCILPWIHLSTRTNGKLRLCCTSNASSVSKTNDKIHGGEVGILKTDDGLPANLNTSTLSEAWNNNFMKTTRLQMLRGEKPASCLKCYKEEQSGHISKRNWETEYWAPQIDIDQLVADTAEDGSVPQKLYYVDLRLGSKCNLKCIICGPDDSSSWIPDWQKLVPKLQNESLKETMSWNSRGKVAGSNYNWHKNNPKFWEEFYAQIPHIKQLYFAGGEPLIIDEHYTLLKEIINQGYAKDVELRYNSNGTTFPEELFPMWEQFRKVRFHFSIDSIFKMNEYIRYPESWEIVEKHLDLLDKTGDNVIATIACTIQLLNVYYIPDFMKWKMQKGYKKINVWPHGAGTINSHFLYHPPHFNVKVLPKWFKEKTEEKYNEFYKWAEDNWELSYAPSKQEFLDDGYGIKRLQGILNFMKSEDWSNRLPETKEFLEKMDEIRGTNWKDTFPEMKDIFDGI